jgi:hypothetical protein
LRPIGPESPDASAADVKDAYAAVLREIEEDDDTDSDD